MRRTVPAIAALGVGLALTVSGCFANPLEQLTEGLVEGGIEQIVEDQTGVNIDVDGTGTGASLPDNWPADVPTVDGNVLFSASSDGLFTAAITVSDAAAAQEAFTALIDAGFTETSFFDLGDGNSSKAFENATYNVGVITGVNEDGTATVQYTIIPLTE